MAALGRPRSARQPRPVGRRRHQWWLEGYVTAANFVEFETKMQRPVYFGARPYAVWRGTSPATGCVLRVRLALQPRGRARPRLSRESSIAPALRRLVYELLEDEEWPHPRPLGQPRLGRRDPGQPGRRRAGTVPEIDRRAGDLPAGAELVCVGLFTVEYGSGSGPRSRIAPAATSILSGAACATWRRPWR